MYTTIYIGVRCRHLKNKKSPNMENRETKCNYLSKSLINLAFAKEDSENNIDLKYLLKIRPE
jgi:hypothetical protein